MADHPPPLLLDAGQEAGRVDEGDERHAEARRTTARTARALLAGLDVERAGEVQRLVGDDADRPAVDAGERGDDRRGVAGPQLEQVAVVDDVGDELAHVVGLVRRRPARSPRPGSRAGRRGRSSATTGGSSATLAGRNDSTSATRRQGLVLVGGDQVGDAAAAGVDGGAAEHVARLTLRPGHRLDGGRAAHVGDGVVGDHHDVGQAEQQRRPAHARRRSTTRQIGTTPLAWVSARATVPQAWRLATPWRTSAPPVSSTPTIGTPASTARRTSVVMVWPSTGPMAPWRLAAGQAEPADGVAVELDDAGLDGPAAPLGDRQQRSPPGGGTARGQRRRAATGSQVEPRHALVHCAPGRAPGWRCGRRSRSCWTPPAWRRPRAAPPATTSTSRSLAGRSWFAVGRHRARGDGQQRCHRLDRAGGTDEVAGHALGGGDRDGAGAEHLGDGGRLGGVVERRRGAVGVDVADVGRREAGVGEGQLHARHRAGAALGRRGDVVGVAGAAVAEHLAEIGGAAGRRPTPRSSSTRNAGPLPHHEAVAGGVEGPAGGGRVGVRRQRAHAPERGRARRA